MGDIDDKLFKKYSNNKNFNCFINEFEKDKEKVAKELKEINILVKHYIEMDEMDENSESDLNYLILLMLLHIFCMNTLKNERVILIGENSQKLLSTLCN